jgi:hypothetical protein
MSIQQSNSTLFMQAGEVLTKLTLDARSAVCNVSDQDSRIYAFGLTNLCSTLSLMLSTVVWKNEEETGREMLGYVRRFIAREPNAVPGWLKTLSESWNLSGNDTN